MQNAFLNEKTCLARLAEGNEKAFRYIFDTYHAKIYTYALRFLKSEEAAREVVQDVFLKLWLNRAAANDVQQLGAYLRTLSKNRALTLLKQLALEQKSRRESTKDWKEGQHTTEEAVAYNETYALLIGALQGLPPRQRDVYTRCQLEGQRQQQVADELHISINTVKAHLQQASATIKQYMADHASTLPVSLLIILSHWL